MSQGGVVSGLLVVVTVGMAVAYGSEPPLVRFEYVEPQMGTHRTPGETTSPVLTRSNGAALAAPQSLP